MSNIENYFAEFDAETQRQVDEIGANREQSRKDRLGYKKENKVNRLAAEDANTLDAAELQFQVGERLGDDQVFKREDGSLYKNQRGIFGGYDEVDFDGKTKNVYIDNTLDGNMKIGLASLGFDRRYGENKNGYGWKPGRDGVTIEDGALMDIMLPAKKADELEYLVHSNKGQIENRAGGNTYNDYNREKERLGSGATEYTTQNAPLWNIDYKQKVAPLGSDTMMPTIPRRMKQEKIDNSFRSAGIGDRMLNTLKAGGSMVAGGIYDIADLGVELLGGDLGTDEQKTAQVDKLIGYDRSFTANAAEVAKQKIETMNDTEWTAGGVLDVIVEAAQTPELLGESVGYMFMLMAGGPAGWATKANKAAKAVNAAKKAGDIKAVAKLSKTADEYKKLAKENGVIKNALDKVSENAGLIALSAGTTNDDLDKYAELAGIEKDDIGAGKIIGSFGGSLLLNSLDRVIDKAIYFNPVVRNGLIQAVGGATKKELKQAGKGLAEVTAAIGVGSGVEAATEYAQTFIEQVNQQFGKETARGLADIWKNEDNQLDRAVGGLLGAAGANQMQAAGTVGASLYGTNKLVGKTKEIYNTAKERRTEGKVEDERVERENYDISEMVDESDFEDAENVVMAEFDKEIKDLRDGMSVKDLSSKYGEERIVELARLDRVLKRKKLQRDVNSGETDQLNATPEDEDMYIDAYVNASTQEIANKFKEKMTKIDPSYSEVFQYAEDLRKYKDSMSQEMSETRDEKIMKGLDDTRKSTMQYFKEGLGYKQGSKDRQRVVASITKFADSQQNKIDTLTAGKNEAVDDMSDKVSKLSKDTGLTKQEIVEAMAYNSSSMSKHPSYKASYEKAISSGATNSQLNLKKSNKVVSYAREGFQKIAEKFSNRKDGTFEINEDSTLLDYVSSESGLRLDKLNSSWKSGSAVDTLITAIDREQQSILRAKNLLDKKKKEPIVEKESSISKFNPIDEGFSEYDSEEIGSGNIPKTSSANEIVDKKIEPRLKDEIRSDIKELIKQLSIEKSKLKKGKSTQDDVNKIIDYIAQSRQELNNTIAQQKNENKKIADTADKNIANLKKLKKILINKIDKMDDSIDIIEEKLQETAVIRSKIYELKVGRWKKIDTKIKMASMKTKSLIKEYKLMRKEYDYNPDANIKFNEEDMLISDIKKEITIMNKLSGSLTKLREKIANEFLSIVKLIKLAKAEYRLAKEEKREMIAGISEIDKQVAMLEKEAEQLAGKDWNKLKKKKSKILDEFSKINKINEMIVEEKEKKKTNLYADHIIERSFKIVKSDGTIVNSHSDTTEKYAKSGGQESVKGMNAKEKREAGLMAKYTTPLVLSNILKAGKAKSLLATAELSTNELNKIVADGELESMKNELIPKKITPEKLAAHPYFMLLLGSYGEINKNVAAAMIIAVDNYTKENYNALIQLTERDVESMYGKQMIGRIDIDKNGIPNRLVANRIATDIMNILGLKPIKAKLDKDGKEISKDQTEMYEKISNGLAMAAIMHAQNQGKLKEANTKASDGESTIYSVKLSDHNINQEGFKEWLNNRVKSFEELGIEEENTKPSTKPIVKKIEDIVKKNDKYTKPSKTIAKAIVKYGQEKFTTNKEVIDLTLGIKRDNLKKLLGYKDDKNNGLTHEEKISIRGKNLQVNGDIEALSTIKEMNDIGESSNGIYFNWSMTKAGRTTMEGAGGFNPQSIKLHRFAVSVDGNVGTVIKGEFSETMFKLGIAQALGFGIDKNSVENSISFADKILANIGIIEQSLKDGVSEVEIDGETVEIEEITHVALAIIEGKKYNKIGSGFETTMTVEIDGRTNGFAHKMLQYLATDKGESNSKHGRTKNITENTVMWLKKVGIEIDEKAGAKSIVDKIGDGEIIDAYLTLGDEIASEEVTIIQQLENRLKNDESKQETKDSKNEDKFGTSDTKEILDKATKFENAMPNIREDNKLSQFVRKLMKKPFMTFGYAAGFTSMSNAISAEFIDDAMHRVMNTKKSDKDYNEVVGLMESLGFTTSNEQQNLQNDLRTKRYYEIVNKDGITLEDAFKGMIRGVYGDAVQDVMLKHFPEMKAINKSIVDTSTAMYSIFKAGYDREVKKLGKTDGEVTPEEQDNIIRNILWEIFPMVKGPVSEGFEDGISLYSTSSVRAAENDYGPIRAYSKIKGKGRTVRSNRYEIVSGGSSAAVIPIQHLDGAGASARMNKESVLQLFDAYLLGVNQDNIVSDANKDFFEIGINSGWSHIEAMKNGLERSLNGMRSVYKDSNTMNQANEIFKQEQFKIATSLPEDKVKTIDMVLAKITSETVSYKQRLEKFMEKNISVEQFPLDAYHKYTHPGSLGSINDKVEHNISRVDVKSGSVAIAAEKLNDNQMKYIVKKIENILSSTVDTVSNVSNNNKQVAVAYGPIDYKYSKNGTHKAKKMPEFISKLGEMAENKLGKDSGYYNHVLINRFNNYGIGMHTDNEKIYIDSDGKVGAIGIYSIGETSGNHIIGNKKFNVESGSLVEMSSGDILHSVPKSNGIRYSITFRHVPKENIMNTNEKKPYQIINEMLDDASVFVRIDSSPIFLTTNPILGYYDPVMNKTSIQDIDGFNYIINYLRDKSNGSVEDYYKAIDDMNIKYERSKISYFVETISIGKIKNNTTINLIQNNLNDMQNSINKTIENIPDIIAITKAHERIHETARNFINDNQDDYRSIHIKNMYESLREYTGYNKGKLDNKFTLKTNGAYWLSSIDEFLAIGLTDPELVAILSDLSMSDIGIDSRGSFLENIIKVMLKIIGLPSNRNSSVYINLLSSYNSIISNKDKSRINKNNISLTEVNTKELKESKDNKSIGATDYSGLDDVIVTDKELADLKKYNKDFEGKYPEMIKDGKDFRYMPDTNTITVVKPSKNNDVTDEMYEVYLAHEIKHALTYKWISENENSGEFKYLNKALKEAFDKIENEFIDSEEKGLLYNRLKYAIKQKTDINKVAEIVAILSSEPNIRNEFIKMFPQKKSSILNRILNEIKKYIGIDTELTIQTVDYIVANGKIEVYDKDSKTVSLKTKDSKQKEDLDIIQINVNDLLATDLGNDIQNYGKDLIEDIEVDKNEKTKKKEKQLQDIEIMIDTKDMC